VHNNQGAKDCQDFFCAMHNYFISMQNEDVMRRTAKASDRYQAYCLNKLLKEGKEKIRERENERE